MLQDSHAYIGFAKSLDNHQCKIPNHLGTMGNGWSPGTSISLFSLFFHWRVVGVKNFIKIV